MQATKICTAGGTSFSYIELGEGETPLVFLHGIGSRARSWSGQLQEFAKEFRVIAWDAPGYGGSMLTESESPSAENYADRLAGLLAALSIERLHLVGHSFGSVIAARFAADRPQRLFSLTLASVAPGHGALPEAERKRLFDARVADLDALGVRGMAEKRAPRLLSPSASLTTRQLAIDTMATVDPEGYRRAARMLSDVDTRSIVAQIDKSVRLQIVYGEEDGVATPEINLRIAQASPHALVHPIKGGGHAVYLERAEEFNKVLRRFFGGAVH